MTFLHNGFVFIGHEKLENFSFYPVCVDQKTKGNKNFIGRVGLSVCYVQHDRKEVELFCFQICGGVDSGQRNASSQNVIP